MEITDYLLLLVSYVLMWYIISTLLSKKVLPQPQPQPPPQINELDLQFDERNFPSKIFDNVFSSNVYQGGYNMDQGKTKLLVTYQK